MSPRCHGEKKGLVELDNRTSLPTISEDTQVVEKDVKHVNKAHTLVDNEKDSVVLSKKLLKTTQKPMTVRVKF